jgi:DNA repair protein RadC
METKLFDIKPLTTNKVQWCKEDRPDYKISTLGRSALSDSELVACIIREVNSLDLSRSVLNSTDNNLSQLSKYNYPELRKLGLTHNKAITLLASFELGNRRKLSELPNNFQIRCSKDVYDYFSPLLIDLKHEEFWIMFLNRANKVIGKMKLSQGGISETVTDVRIILKKAIEHLASGIIVCHNHPSGNLNPSESDTTITKKIKESGNIMDIQLLDHLIICEREFYSFADNGLL